MGKVISLRDMAKMYCIDEAALEELARKGVVPAHEHALDGHVIFTDADMFAIERQRLLNRGASRHFK